MGLETAAIVAGGGAAIQGLTDLYGTYSANRQTKRRNKQAESYITPMLGQGDVGGVGMLEEYLKNAQQGPGSVFNTGQDALMQMLRGDPNSKMMSTLESMTETGNPFDTSNVFKTLSALDNRKRGEALGDLRAGAGGLGQRFGSSMMKGENDLLAQLLQQTEARDAQIAMGSHEAAQGRRLQAADLLGGVGRDKVNVAQALMGSETQKQGMMLQGLSQLIGAQQGGRNQNLGALSLLLGMPIGGQQYNTGSTISDFGSLMLLMDAAKKQPTTS